MTVHVFRARNQPATRFRIELCSTVVTIHNKRRAQLRSNCCRQLRYAANLTAHVYYDGVWFYCRPGKGCKC